MAHTMRCAPNTCSATCPNFATGSTDASSWPRWCRDCSMPLHIRRRCPTSWQQWMRNVGNQVKRSEEHTSELQSLMRISYAVFCLKKKKKKTLMLYKKLTSIYIIELSKIVILK